MECKDQEEREGPLLETTRTRGRATSAQTLGNIVVSILGTGALSLPYAFRVAGWAAASLGLLIAAVATYYCMLLLLECRKKAEEDAQESDSSLHTQTYGDVGAVAFGVTGRFLVETLILISHAGASVAYFIFMGQNLSSILTPFNPSCSSSSLVFLLLLPLELILSFIRSLSLLAPFNVFALICNVFAMAVVIKEDVNKISKDYSFVNGINAFNGAWSVPFACGVVVFCFEGIGMTLPLEGSMAKPQRFGLVSMHAFVGIAFVYICFGSFGYLAFGEETKEIITLNLANDWSSMLVKVGLSTAIAFTFPMVVHPIHEIIETKLNSNSSRSKDHCSQLARLLVVAAMAMLATSAPGFAQIVSLTGSTICALTSFVLPASFHLKILGSELSLRRRVVDYAIVLVGLVFAVYGTYSAIHAAL